RAVRGRCIPRMQGRSCQAVEQVFDVRTHHGAHGSNLHQAPTFQVAALSTDPIAELLAALEKSLDWWHKRGHSRCGFPPFYHRWNVHIAKLRSHQSAERRVLGLAFERGFESKKHRRGKREPGSLCDKGLV